MSNFDRNIQSGEELVKVETGEDVAVAPIEETLFNRYQGISAVAFDQQSCAKLLEPVDSADVEIRPDGLIYLPEIKYRKRLNQAFGPGAWALMPTERPTIRDNVIMRPFALYVHGRFVSEAIGEQEYFENNPQMTWATAAEGAKSNAIMRCCKDLGIASELWDPGFIEKWKKEYATQVWLKDKPKPVWRRKDREPFWNEKPRASGANTEPVQPVKTSDHHPILDTTNEPPEVNWDNLEKEYKQTPVDPVVTSPVAHDPEAKPPSDDAISDKQSKRFWAIAKGAKWTDEQIKAFFTQANIKGTKYIKKSEYNYLCERFAKGPEVE